jgi:D-amino-acid oxidase
MKEYSNIPVLKVPSPFTHGCKYTSVAIDVPVYLSFLFDSCVKSGAEIIRTTLSSSGSFKDFISEAKAAVEKKFKGGKKEKIHGFVNATGISASKIVPDENVFPIRGQTVVVKGVAKTITTNHFPTEDLGKSDPQVTYIIPRAVSGTTVLGGTKQDGNWQVEPDAETSSKILEEAKKWAPELLDKKGEFEVLDVRVGFRPGRKGGARVELEKNLGLLICHAYGNAGGGYQNSIGVGEKVVKLLGGSGRSKM